MQTILFNYGVEFPCGGRGTCHSCKIKILDGSSAVTVDDKKAFDDNELSEGWRLACRSFPTDNITIEIPQWELNALSDSSQFSFFPRDGYGIAVDLGSTTIVAQLIDLQSGSVCGVQSELNEQAIYGADVMSRIEYILGNQGTSLTAMTRRQLYRLCKSLLHSSRIEIHRLQEVIICGNTVMHHIFHGYDVTSLSRIPFMPKKDSFTILHLSPSDIEWQDFSENLDIVFLPGIGGLVGSDISLGIIAMNMHKNDDITCLIDLGTNGEIVIGNKDRLLCTSTAAGPAFEGARISMGMQATTGAIYKVERNGNDISFSTFGNSSPRGICGSGLVDAAATGLSLGIIHSNGRLHPRHSPWILARNVTIIQKDIRELQLAKSAISTGIKILLDRLRANVEDVKTAYLAGGLGNSVNPDSAYQIGLYPFDPGIVVNAGNTALHGVKLHLFADTHQSVNEILPIAETISLNEHPEFTNLLIDEMAFPSDREGST